MAVGKEHVKIVEGCQCAFEGCTAEATGIACGRKLFGDSPGHPEPDGYCEKHAKIVSSEREPEYVETCPNCGCTFGVV